MVAPSRSNLSEGIGTDMGKKGEKGERGEREEKEKESRKEEGHFDEVLSMSPGGTRSSPFSVNPIVSVSPYFPLLLSPLSPLPSLLSSLSLSEHTLLLHYLLSPPSSPPNLSYAK